MQVFINSQVLASELRLLAKVVPAKPVIPILSHALLTARDGLSLYATNLEVGLSMTVDVNVDAPGAVALPVGKLLAMVEQFPDADVSISVDKVAVVKCGAFTSHMQAMPVADFPAQAPIEGASITLDGGSFQHLVARTRYAIAQTTSRRILQGALLTVKGDTAAMVATDSKRLALATTGCAGEARVVIPAKALDILQGDGDVTMTVGPRHLFFEVGRCLLTSRTFDGEYPAYERIIPRDNNKKVVVERAAFAAAIRRVLVAAEDNRAVRLTIAPGTMLLASKSAEVGTADESVIITYDGTPLKVCINGGYVLDFLDAAAGDTVTMQLKDESSAALLTDGIDYLTVIMLMRG